MKAKRTLAFTLALVLVISCMSITAFAADTKLKYLSPVYNTAGDPSTGLAGWTVETVPDTAAELTNATKTLESAWYKVTSQNVTYATNDTITLSTDVSIYVASGKTLQLYNVIGGHTLTIYGNGTVKINGENFQSALIGNLIVNGNAKVDVQAAGGWDSDHPNGMPGVDGNVVINAGTGSIYGGNGANSAQGNGGAAIDGDFVANGGSYLISCGNSFNYYADVATVTGQKKLNNVTITDEKTNSPPYWFSYAPTTYYAVESACENGSISVGTTKAYKKGATVEVKFYPAAGYALSSLTCDGTTISPNASGKYTFTMPEKNVILSAEFAETTKTIAFTPKSPAPSIEVSKTVAIGTMSASEFTGTPVFVPTVYTEATGDEVAENISAVMDTDGTTLNIVSSETATVGQYYVGMVAVAGTENAALDSRIPITVIPSSTGDADLDLEADTEDILDSKSIDQLYTKAEAGPDYVYNHRIWVEWVNTPMEIKVADAKKWDVNNLEWVTDDANNGVATLVEGTNVKTFTLTNYSAKAFDCSLTFTLNSELSSDLQSSYVAANTTITNDNTTTSGRLDAVINDEAAMTTDSKYFTGDEINTEALPTLKFTATLGVDATKFNNAAATTEAVKYGAFNITCTVATN